MEKLPESPKAHPYKNASRIGIAILTAMIGVAIGIKKCTETRTPQKIEKEEKERPIKKVEHRKIGQKPVPKLIVQPPNDIPLPVSAPEVLVPPEFTLEEACQNLADAPELEDDGAIYQALMEVGEFFDEKTQEDASIFLKMVNKKCKNLNQKQLMRILNKAILEGDSRIAILANELIQQLCLKEDTDASETDMSSYTTGIEQCSSAPSEIPTIECRKAIFAELDNACANTTGDEREGCLKPYVDKMSGCDGLSDVSPRLTCQRTAREQHEERKRTMQEAKKTCQSRTAQNLGLDIGAVRTGNALAHANQLATLKLAFMNPDIPISEEDFSNYIEAIRQIILSKILNDDKILKELGLKNEEDFVKSYVQATIDILTKRGKEDMAESIELAWQLGLIIGN